MMDFNIFFEEMMEMVNMDHWGAQTDAYLEEQARQQEEQERLENGCYKCDSCGEAILPDENCVEFAMRDWSIKKKRIYVVHRRCIENIENVEGYYGSDYMEEQ